MTTTPDGSLPSTALTELSERQRQRALDRYQTLRPHLEEDVSLARVAMEASLPLRTAQDWVSRYRRFGLAGLTRAGRVDQGKRRRFGECSGRKRSAIGPNRGSKRISKISGV